MSARALTPIAQTDIVCLVDFRRFLMNSRYLTNVALILGGAFLVVTSQAFGVSSFEWLMLGIGVLAVLTSGVAVERSRGRVQRALDGTIGLLGAWTIVASLVFAGSV